jgi:hypothetical protein
MTVIKLFFKNISNAARFLVVLWWLILIFQIWVLFNFNLFSIMLSIGLIISWLFLGIYNLRYKEIYLFEK